MQRRKVWVYLTDAEAKELDEKKVVALETPYPTTLNIFAFKNKPLPTYSDFEKDRGVR